MILLGPEHICCICSLFLFLYLLFIPIVSLNLCCQLSLPINDWYFSRFTMIHESFYTDSARVSGLILLQVATIHPNVLPPVHNVCLITLCHFPNSTPTSFPNAAFHRKTAQFAFNNTPGNKNEYPPCACDR